MEKNILNNNLKYVIVPINNKDIVSIQYKFLFGFNNEFKGINNFTHLLEHLMAYYFNYKECTVKKIKNLLYKKNFKSNAFTSQNDMTIWIDCYQKDVNFFLNLLSRTLYKLCITQKNLDMSKQNVINELKLDEDLELYNGINKYVYKRNKVDFSEGVKDVSKCNLQMINDFYKNIMSSDMIIGIACNKKNINYNKKLIIKYFSKKFTTNKNKYPAKLKIHYLTKNTIFKIYKPIKSVKINIVIPLDILFYSKEYWELKIALNYLFNFNKGPFYAKLRNEKKIIYSINYNFDFNKDSSKTLLIIKTGCEKEDLNKFFKLFYNIFNKIKISNKDFLLMKKNLIFSTKYNYMNNIGDCLGFNMGNYLYNINISYKKNINNLEKAECNKNIFKKIKKNKHFIFLLNKDYKKI
jgi:predicted Zn-dependent peptidase